MAGIRATMGILSANAIYFLLSASGLAILHSFSAELFAVIKWCGAAYLVWLGINMILRSFDRARLSMASEPEAAASSPFVRGFITQGANPNLIVYFTAILPQFVDPDQDVAPQVALLACSSFVIEFSILSMYAALAGRAGESMAPGFRAIIDRVAGGFLIAAAVGISQMGRPG
jgi:threonine/homoserine/homoserine lactone efflux protein